ncbi:MAG: histidine kinase dimerization/phospho-acceptor domain-containing protein [Eubacteriales bacterium]|nr:histidine kinase dimerization/phospho-acceptor domain-containing protein [Eubacteriales bacterium]
MRGKYYSLQSKRTAILLAHIVFLILFMSTLFYLRTINNSAMWMEKETSSNYVESEIYRNQVMNEVDSLMRYLSGKCKFETNGMYDPDRIVDIADYVKKDIITGEITHGIGYYLKDLLAWQQEGVEYYNVDEISDTPPLKEIYAPIGYSSILEYASKTGVSAADYYYYLSCTVDAIWDDVWQYNQNKNHFPGDRTNLKYAVFDQNDRVIFSNTDLSEEEIKNLGTYILMDFWDLSVDSDITALTNDLFNFLSSIPAQLRESRLVIGIDTDFPIEDEFYEYGQQYVKYWKTITMSVILEIISGVCFLILICYLTVTTGKIDHNSRIYSKDFDKIPIEILLALIAGDIAVIGYSMFRLLGEIHLNAVLVICYGVLILVVNIIGVSAYLSIVRRARTGTIWKKSMVRWLVRGIHKCVLNRRITTRMVLYYTAFAAMHIFCMILFGYQKGILILLGFDFLFLYFLLREGVQRSEINEGIEHLKNGDIDYQFDLEKFNGNNREMAESINLIGNGIKKTVSENLKSERLKADLITNVSHDLKTPLTSIINYVDLLKRQNVQDEKAVEYLKILENKSQRLKHLTEDLLEASKISSGNIKLEWMKINFKELILQTNGEFSEKFEEKGLDLIVHASEGQALIWADGRRIWRIVENLYNNVFKYAMPNTRVYVDINIKNEENEVEFSIKNISQQALNIEASELTERFIRGDISRSTEGSGLGLSIAKNLTELQNGEFLIYLDGDLFKVTVKFPLVSSDNTPEDLVMTAEESETVGEEQAQEQEETETEMKKESLFARLGKKKTGSIRERKMRDNKKE